MLPIGEWCISIDEGRLMKGRRQAQPTEGLTAKRNMCHLFVEQTTTKNFQWPTSRSAVRHSRPRPSATHRETA